MEARGNLGLFPPFRVPGWQRSRGRVRHIAHIPKCRFRTRAAKAPTTNNFSFVAGVRAPSCPVRFQYAGLIPEARKRAGMDQIARPVWGRSADAIWRRERELRGTFGDELEARALTPRVWP
jgi:hypothetical protein